MLVAFIKDANVLEKHVPTSVYDLFDEEIGKERWILASPKQLIFEYDESVIFALEKWCLSRSVGISTYEVSRDRVIFRLGCVTDVNLVNQFPTAEQLKLAKSVRLEYWR